MHVLLQLIRKKGFCFSYKKVVGPTYRITFLGVGINNCGGTLSLGQDKLQQVKQQLRLFSSRRCTSKQQLQSLAGLLKWSTQVIRGEKVFLRRIVDAGGQWPVCSWQKKWNGVGRRQESNSIIIFHLEAVFILMLLLTLFPPRGNPPPPPNPQVKFEVMAAEVCQEQRNPKPDYGTASTEKDLCLEVLVLGNRW